jgi:hypothetical protein
MFWKKSSGTAVSTLSCPSSEEGMIDAKSGCRDAVCELCNVSTTVVVVSLGGSLVGILSRAGEMWRRASLATV